MADKISFVDYGFAGIRYERCIFKGLAIAVKLKICSFSRYVQRLVLQCGCAAVQSFQIDYDLICTRAYGSVQNRRGCRIHLQPANAFKSAVTQIRYLGGNAAIHNGSAAGEGSAADACYGAARQSLQAGAAGEGIVRNGCDVVREYDYRDIRISREGCIADTGYLDYIPVPDI